MFTLMLSAFFKAPFWFCVDLLIMLKFEISFEDVWIFVITFIFSSIVIEAKKERKKHANKEIILSWKLPCSLKGEACSYVGNRFEDKRGKKKEIGLKHCFNVHVVFFEKSLQHKRWKFIFSYTKYWRSFCLNCS